MFSGAVGKLTYIYAPQERTKTLINGGMIKHAITFSAEVFSVGNEKTSAEKGSMAA
jgi:hypothetical protein